MLSKKWKLTHEFLKIGKNKTTELCTHRDGISFQHEERGPLWKS